MTNAPPRSLPPMTAAACRRRGIGVIGATAGILVVLSAIGIWADADLRLAEACYRPGAGWFLGGREPWHWLYEYGTIPGIALSICALLVFGASFVKTRIAPWRYPALVVVLTAVIGAGFLVNTVLKPYWGRPRPDQTVAFGGLWEYRDVYLPGTPGKGESFPCGHCTMGFVFLSLCFTWRRSPGLAVAGGTAGVVLGGLLSAARIVQGAHYLLDTLWSMGVILLTAQACYYLLLAVPAKEAAAVPMTRRQKRLLTVTIAVAVVVMAAAFSTRRPFYRTYTAPFPPPASGGAVTVDMNAAPSRFQVRYEDVPEGRIRIDSRGFGWAGFKFDLVPGQRRVGNHLWLDIDIRVDSYFSELRHAVVLTLPSPLEDRVDVQLATADSAPSGGNPQ